MNLTRFHVIAEINGLFVLLRAFLAYFPTKTLFTRLARTPSVDDDE